MIKILNTIVRHHYKNNKQFLFFLLIIVCSLLIRLLYMHHGSLLVEETYYWNYAQHLDFSYLDHPPMVALLIKLFTCLLGNHEFTVRLASLLCWFIAAFFSYKLTELINKGSGIYALTLLAILPFFFAQSIVITPDAPLIACWSAALYCLYRCLVLNESHYWYVLGVCLGLGMLSKYTISLLGIATLCYALLLPHARHWFTKKEPYICILISILLFTPVIYWNATHEWVSFIFQSNRRWASFTSIDLHYVMLLTLIFITPIGVWGLLELCRKNSIHNTCFNNKIRRFIQIFTFIPLGFFALFSLNHEINFNWIGPLFLALIPWLAILTEHTSLTRTLWLRAGFILLLGYTSVLLIVNYNTSEKLQRKLLVKVIAWESLIKQFNEVAKNIEEKTQSKPIFVPLDKYSIGSELTFYQTKLLAQHHITQIYPIIGVHIFGRESLMYRYWDKKEELMGRPLIIISKELWRFDDPELTSNITELAPLAEIWSQGQGQRIKNIPYYYKVVQMRS